MIDPKWESVLNWNATVAVVTGGVVTGAVVLPYPPPELFEQELNVLSTMTVRNVINKYLSRMISELEIDFVLNLK